MSRVGGVTYYCRYVVLPLSYVSRQGLDELRRSGALHPPTDIEGIIRRWQNESFASLVSTFQHELVHVHTNTAIGVPDYSNRSDFPIWFHEGTATYLGADPHSGLSKGYREFQDLFFYLAQRHRVSKLRDFYSGVLGGTDVGTALREVYGLAGSDQLFRHSSRRPRSRGGDRDCRSSLWAQRPGSGFCGRGRHRDGRGRVGRHGCSADSAV